MLGLFLRVWNIQRHGFSHYDEAHYMMEAKFWRSVFDNSGDLCAALRAGKLNAAFVESHIDGLPPSFTPKPFHSLFIALFSMATGISDEWSGCLWAALTGTLTFVLVGLWTARHFGDTAGVLASLLLAVTRSHVMYSRSQLAEADAILFFLIAAFMHADRVLKKHGDSTGGVADSPWPAISVGALYGVAIGVNYRCLLVIPLVWMWDVGVSREGAGALVAGWPKNAFKRLAWMAAGILAVACLIELPYRIYIWRGGTLPAGMMTYFQGFWARCFQDLPMGEKKVSSFIKPHLGILRDYLFLDGYRWLFGIALGLWALTRIKSPALTLVTILALAPIAVFSLVTRGDGPRAVSTSIPFFSVMAAVGLAELMRANESKSSVAMTIASSACALLIAALLLEAGLQSVCATELQARSAWPKVGRWLTEQPRELVRTTYPLAARYYLRKDLAALPPQGDTAAPAPGLWVIDRYNAEYAYPYPVVKTVISSYKPVLVFEGDVYPKTGLFLDWGVFMRSADWRGELKREHMGQIEIYRIDGGPGR